MTKKHLIKQGTKMFNPSMTQFKNLDINVPGIYKYAAIQAAKTLVEKEKSQNPDKYWCGVYILSQKNDRVERIHAYRKRNGLIYFLKVTYILRNKMWMELIERPNIGEIKGIPIGQNPQKFMQECYVLGKKDKESGKYCSYPYFNSGRESYFEGYN